MSETHCANCGADLSGVRIHACCNHPCRAVDFPMAFPPDPIPGLQAEIARLTAAIAQSRAETQAALAGCVKIKPLFWAEGEFEDCIEANAYNIWAEANGYQVYFWSVGCGPRHPDQAAAIEFAQWLHKAIIRAAIQPDTSKLALVREAIVNIVNHDAFQDEEYMSEDLIEKLNAARAAIASIGEEPRHD